MSRGSFAPAGQARPWTPGSFDAAAPGARDREPAAERETVVLPTAAEIEAMQEQARQEAWHAGYREGFAQGEAEGAAMLALAESFRREIERLDLGVAAEVTTLALAVAQRVITAAYAADPDIVARLVEHALQTLGSDHDPARVLLHADDLAVVERHFGGEFAGRRIQVCADRAVTRGGCRIVTAALEIDGTLETRWARVTEILGGGPWGALDGHGEAPARGGEPAEPSSAAAGELPVTARDPR